MTEREKGKAFICIVLILGSLCMIFPSVFSYIQNVKLSKSGSRTFGEIVEKKIVEREVESGSAETYESFEFTYVFKVNNNSFNGNCIVSKRKWQQLSQGQKIEIMYDPEKPKISRPAYEANASIFKYLLFPILGLMGIVWSFYIWFYQD